MSNRRCAAKTCFNLQGCRPNLKFFPFPKDEAACRVWATNSGRTDLLDKPLEQLTKFLLCADHFEQHWFLNPKYKTVFVRSGQPIPTIFHNNLADFIPESLRKQFELKHPKKKNSDEILKHTEEDGCEKASDENESSTELNTLSTKHGCYKMCRLCACLVYEDKLMSLFSEESEQKDLLGMINKLLPEKLQVEAGDGLPHHVCSACILKLNDCSEIVDAFIAADKKLRDLFQNTYKASQSLTYIKLQEDSVDKPNTTSFELHSTPSDLSTRNDEYSFLDPENTKDQSHFDTASTEAYTLESGADVSQETGNESDPCELQCISTDSYTPDNYKDESDKWMTSEVNLGREDSEATSEIDRSEKEYVCSVCKKTFREKHKLLIHEISQHIGDMKNTNVTLSSKKYKRRETRICAECGNSFHGLKPLKRHIREYHIPAENICEFCGAHYKIKSQLEVHRRLHTDEKPFTCTVCDESFHFKKALRRHKRLHVEPKSLTCSVCSKTFLNRSAMWRHEQIHSSNRSVLCYLCGKVLSNSQSLRVHMRTHSTDRPCSCPTCGKTFRDNISVNKHMVMHSAVKNFKCDICGRAFYSKGLVKQHKLSHSGVKPHKCEVCGAAFNRLGNLNQHKKKHIQDGTLDQIKPNLTHMCVVCGKMMKSELTLKYHLAKHTGEKKPFDCEVCGKRFVAVDPYRVHMRIHTGERPYECNKCEKTFRSAFTLKQHSALHKDEFPYPCTFCERRFKRLQSLVVHKRTHTGEKPHPCPICGRGFAQKGDMLKHTKTHNRDRKPVAMELEQITELVLSDTEITSEFLIDMPIVEVETEMNSDIHSEMQSDLHVEMQADISHLEAGIAIKPDIVTQMHPVIHAAIEPCIHVEIQPDIHPDMGSDIDSDIASGIHSQIHTVIETEIYPEEMQT